MDKTAWALDANASELGCRSDRSRSGSAGSSAVNTWAPLNNLPELQRLRNPASCANPPSGGGGVRMGDGLSVSI